MPRRLTPREKDIKALPAGFQPCADGDWKLREEQGSKLSVVYEEEFENEHLSSVFVQTYKLMGAQTKLKLFGLGETVTRNSIFQYLLKAGIPKITEPTSEQLVLKKHDPTNDEEIMEFIATKHLRSTYSVSTERAFRLMKYEAEEHGFKLMEIERYNEILHCLRGFPVSYRSAQDEEYIWWQQGNMLRNLEKLEVAMFENSCLTLFNKENGLLTLDDELIGSRADDVESKILSQRKSGKEGPVADCVASSQTGVLFGMRLRLTGESTTDNIDKLLATLPINKNNVNIMKSKNRLVMDRGYGTEKNVKIADDNGYDVCAFAASVGSKHPIIPLSVYDIKRKEWENKVKSSTNAMDEGQMKRMEELVKDWVFDDMDAMLGSEASVAVSQNKTKDRNLYAISVRECFDSKTATKHLSFYISGDINDDFGDCWVAKNKPMVVSVKNLFSSKKASEERLAVEALLSKSCYALTVTQRTSAMKGGTKNEYPTVEKLCLEDYVLEFYDVGLLQSIEYPYLGVSPDGILLIATDEEKQYATLEIKSRFGDDAIKKAEMAAKDFGEKVECVYGDDTFKKCVSAEHRTQILHQAFITGLKIAVYAVSKVQDRVGQIVQVVICKIPEDILVEHQQLIVKIGRPLLEWLYDDTVMDQGYLNYTNLPDWMTDQQKKIVLSRSKLWLAFFLKIQKEDGSISTPRPLKLFKHSTQAIYNPGKPGVDKNTELANSIALNGTCLLFEALYILQIIDAITLNAWRAYLAVHICLPFIEEEEGKSHPVTMKELKRQIKNNNVTLQDFKFDLAVDVLKSIHEIRNRTVPSPSIADHDQQMLRLLDHLKKSKVLPTLRSRSRKFETNSDLKRIRLYESLMISHNTDDVMDMKTGKTKTRVQCALCSDSKTYTRNTGTKCSTCQVPLCVSCIPGTSITCFELWHQSRDLIECSNTVKALLSSSRESNRSSPQAQASRTSGQISAIARKNKAALRRQHRSSGTAIGGDDTDSTMSNQIVSPRFSDTETQDDSDTSMSTSDDNYTSSPENGNFERI